MIINCVLIVDSLVFSRSVVIVKFIKVVSSVVLIDFIVKISVISIGSVVPGAFVEVFYFVVFVDTMIL